MVRIIPHRVAVSQHMTTREFLSYVASQGYRANPVLNGLNSEPVGSQPLKVVGYELVGPRRNRKLVLLSSDGLLPLLDVVLWCDGVHGANVKPRRR